MYRPPYHYKVMEREWLLVQRAVPLSAQRAYAVQRGHLRNWLRYHLIVPSTFPAYPVSGPTEEQRKHRILFAPSSKFARDLKNKMGNSCKVWLGTFADGVMPHWPEMAQKKCTSQHLDDPETRWHSIQNALQQAKAAGAHVVILPELTVCPELRQKVAAWLDDNASAFLLIVPGSYHETGDQALPHNRAFLWDGSGREILQHDKLYAFGTDHLCHEQIAPGNKITLWQTSIGIITLAICRDFCEGEGDVRQLWDTLAPDWLLVPSMSFDTGIGAHEAQAKQLYNHCGSKILLANQTPDKQFTSKISHGFVYPLEDGTAGAQWVSPECRLKKINLG
ncbi:MAG: hypothetical protein HQM06_09205 [Magnetococcales bacterium]|nr:hypothetical protein [Magnetococcales bacterium]